MQTGGGPPPVSPKPEDIKIMQMVPLEFEVDSNEFDSDGLVSINISPHSQVCIFSSEMHPTHKMHMKKIAWFLDIHQ